MYLKGEAWDNELAFSIIRLLFFAAIAFNLPDTYPLDGIVSNPKARRIPGTYWADAEDIEFARSLPSDLNALFHSEEEVLKSLQVDLRSYSDKLEREGTRT